MKILTVCWAGDNRSVHLARLLKETKRQEAIAVGLYHTTRSTRQMMYEWADKIILLVPGKKHWIPEEFYPKLEVWEGFDPDIWPFSLNPDLRQLLEERLKSWE